MFRQREGRRGWDLSFMGVPLTCLCLHRDCAAAFPILDPEEQELVFPAGLGGQRTVTSRWSAATGTTWGCPSLSLYWTKKESNSPSGTVQEAHRVRGSRPSPSAPPGVAPRGAL